jgi:hypothetical protein
MGVLFALLFTSERRVGRGAQTVGWVERSETHHLLLCYARAVTNYRRNFICGGSFFFTANLAERRLRPAVDDIDAADNRSRFGER